jgi:hypothetical protein
VGVVTWDQAVTKPKKRGGGGGGLYGPEDLAVGGTLEVYGR